MKKILILTLMVWSLHAQSFDTFVQNALHNSPYLQANNLAINRADAKASLLQRYKNPTLALEASQFSPDVGKNEVGYRGAITQPIRLWGIGNDRKNLANATKNEAKSLVVLQRAEFLKRLSLLYIAYISNTTLTQLAQEEYAISQKIAMISKERYKAGTIAKVKYLQAKVDLASSKNIVDIKKAMQLASYYKLLAFAGQEDEVILDTDYTFVLQENSDIRDIHSSAPLQYLQTQQNVFKAKAALNSNKIEWIDLYGEYEKEPNQGIARFGVDIPLAVFNTKKEERTIAKLQTKQSELYLQNAINRRTKNLQSITKELSILKRVIHSTKELYSSQKELLGMYEDGYKIANINLIELQNIKNQMISTKEKEIFLKKNRDENIVKYNYAVGAYNE